ncbi:MAG: peptidase S16 [Alphaproteobacteria bacterium 64-6]|uniref:LON peptidase substrate-binding domain-containing protein n=1 Tax=Hyphomicrobium sp. CS1BSMeth3 TaxID=1892844 RepID=UPI00086B3A37|nr:LON peptidase substrate-binding domain-containing protein [Hyphomicrobium sp. CS1BSMeth3]MBN9260860.1 LON peptidase substrate-binding domain-containing protein [Hyphomicrobium sp.]MBN9264034.1 LON peptidase substrate-binding domain-containing protein [Hyphomicrobium sp.]ODT29792.1 MAG: peptidase S16 [Hyphomicrobium sp. SCN 65-11]OJU23975.1 MAG: peptidase S16 [Alphaproteobacteria bacterium 64-6]
MKFLEQYRSPSDLPSRIPVFPLLGAITLPRTTLPLNVFEPRYLAMVDDVLRGERIIGIIQPTGDGGTTGSPTSRSAPLQAVGCAARLSAFQEQSDGRLLITLTGICRFDVVGDVTTRELYRTLDVAYERFADDLVASLGAEEVPRSELLSVLQRYLDARHLKPDWEAIEQSENEDLVNGLAIAGPFAPPEKQALLEAATLADRAAALIALAEMDLAGSAAKPGSRLQ